MFTKKKAPLADLLARHQFNQVEGDEYDSVFGALLANHSGEFTDILFRPRKVSLWLAIVIPAITVGFLADNLLEFVFVSFFAITGAIGATYLLNWILRLLWRKNLKQRIENVYGNKSKFTGAQAERLKKVSPWLVAIGEINIAETGKKYLVVHYRALPRMLLLSDDTQ